MYSIDTASPEARAHVSDGIELAYQEFGSSSAVPLLLVMGLGGPMVAWDDAFCLALAERGFRVIRFDNRDCGHSTHLDACGIPDMAAMFGQLAAGLPVQAPYLLSHMADDAVGLLDALEIASAHVVGVSMGGMIAQEMAIRHPRRVASLTSIMSTTGRPGLPAARPEAMSALMTPTPSDWPGYLARHRQVWSVLCGYKYPYDPVRGDAMAQRLFAHGPHPAGTARQLAGVLASGNRKPALADVRIPTLVVHGSDDGLVPMACGIDTAEAIPDARLRILEGMGHNLPFELWPAIVDAIAEQAGPANTLTVHATTNQQAYQN
ncbi:alpha/beta hydrolase [Variovorax robiniae]|uniref:Alpha/beta hydrolase n=1 Tax=Variovorax robiniae TaxID=1836199 RepID=A0ABU8XAU7_9BURK